MSERVIQKPLNKMIFFIVNHHPALMEHTNPALSSPHIHHTLSFILSGSHPRDVCKVISVDFTVAWKTKLGINERTRRAFIY